MSNLKINFELENITNDTIFSNSSGFIVNINNNNIIISVHHYYPFSDNIKILYNNTEYSSSIINRSLWNEIITLKIPDKLSLNKLDIINYKNFRLHCQNYEKFYINDKNIELIKIDNSFIPLGMIPNYPKNIYYKMLCINGTILKSFSGLPIYDNKKRVIGILSKSKNNEIYVLPIIYLIKTLLKKSDDIYFIENYLKIEKVNRYKVTNEKIFYPSFGFNIPIESYFLLEGDKDKMVEITVKNKKKKINYVNINSKLPISSSTKLKNINDKYIINIPLLKYLRLLKKNDIIINIFKLLKNNEKIFLKYNKSNNLFKICKI